MRRLLDYNRRRIWMMNGWCLRFRIKEISITAERPSGIKYSFTLHDAGMGRLLGFDNSHGVPKHVEFDHQHRFMQTDQLTPYVYIDADTLLCDFFMAVEKACAKEGIEFAFDDREIELEEENDDGEKVSD